MKKIVLFFVAAMAASSAFSQKVILVNGGQYGNNSSNVNVVTYDVASKVYTTIDTIQTQSVQELLIDGNIAYVAAQDSIVAYDLRTDQRVAATKFAGLSTKTILVYNNYLLVGNWYGQTSNNLYIYDKSTLALVDSVPQISKGVSSMLIYNTTLFIAQNYSTIGYTDSAGYLAVVNLNTMDYVNDIVFNNNGEDLGHLIQDPSGNGLMAINSVSNSISQYFYFFPSTLTTSVPFDISANASKQTIFNDTLFLEINDRIGAYDLMTKSVIDTNVANYNSVAFTYDTLNSLFYATASDFFSYSEGKIYNRSGALIDTMIVGFSPEVIGMYYNQVTSINENLAAQLNVSIYPNPTTDYITISSKSNELNTQIRIVDLNGRVVYDGVKTSSSDLKLDLTSYPSGAYLLMALSGKNYTVQKIIKN
jgi:hypothetical protein